jgi:hypothetical protein
MSPDFLLNTEFDLDLYEGLEVGERPLPEAALLPADGDPVPQSYNAPLPSRRTAPWDPRLIFDLAVGVDALPEILARYEMTDPDFYRLSELPLFRRELALAIREVRAEGVSFAAKAKVQAEEYLVVLDGMVHDRETPASTRLEAIKSAVKWGRLEPKEDKVDTTNATQVVVNISL